MSDTNENYRDFESVINDQREKGLSCEDIVHTIQQLPSEHIVDYCEFLEQNCPKKMTAEVGEAFLRKLGARNKQYIEKWSSELNASDLDKLESLVLARADNLLDVYLHTVMPEEIINEFVLLKAQRIDNKFEGKYHNALAMIKLAVEIHRVQNPEDLFDTFMEMEKQYYEKNEPSVDVNTFFKLVIPVLRRYSIKVGYGDFQEVRDKIIAELRKHGVNPGHLSIDVLERRGRHRTRPSAASLYKGYELF